MRLRAIFVFVELRGIEVEGAQVAVVADHIVVEV